MKVWAWMLILMGPCTAWAQYSHEAADQELSHYLYIYQAQDEQLYLVENVLSFAHELASKRDRYASEQDFLQLVFQKTHRRFLKHFEADATFAETLAKGRYNCLTGTALYALLLRHFEVNFSIIETNYHIFLLANTTSGQVLLETTDPVNGFVADEMMIERKLGHYRENTMPEASAGTGYRYQYNFKLYKPVSLDEMIGLMHYNLAIAAHNRQASAEAVRQLEAAASWYRSARLEEFSRVVLLSLAESTQLQPDDKAAYIRRVQAIRKQHALAMASAH